MAEISSAVQENLDVIEDMAAQAAEAGDLDLAMEINDFIAGAKQCGCQWLQAATTTAVANHIFWKKMMVGSASPSRIWDSEEIVDSILPTVRRQAPESHANR